MIRRGCWNFLSGAASVLWRTGHIAWERENGSYVLQEQTLGLAWKIKNWAYDCGENTLLTWLGRANGIHGWGEQ